MIQWKFCCECVVVDGFDVDVERICPQGAGNRYKSPEPVEHLRMIRKQFYRPPVVMALLYQKMGGNGR